MKHFLSSCKRRCLAVVSMALMALAGVNEVQADVPLRRPISPNRPMLLVHIDTWNYPDPERIIEMVPEDILPYVVFNISLSASDNVCSDGYKVCDSWLKACAQKRVWAMVQCASGGHSRFSDHDLSVYENYFRQYPNFIGWNFAEQFWGFGEVQEDGTVTPSFLERLSLFCDILKLCHRYGGYLTVSFTQGAYGPDVQPMAYMKRNPELRQLLTEHPEHFICCEKYTMADAFFEVESGCLGAFLGGYAGHYGIRFDDCGWTTTNDKTDPFVKASGAIPIMEHVMLTGQTVIDGPELIWTDVSRELNTSVTPDGYTRRNWGWFPQFVNIAMDEFRKVLDGTVRILTREEVIDRTKICLLNDINDGTSKSYQTPGTFFDGLYRSESDYGPAGSSPWLENKWWMKSTGRYPSLPHLSDLLDDAAKKLQVVKASEYDKRWPTVDAKVKELNELFPQEYTGDIYAAHAENTWMTYNPYQYDDKITNGVRTRSTSYRRASGNIPFLYNTSESISLDFCPYGMAVMKEFPDHVLLYMSNYRLTNDESAEYPNAEDTVRIYGATSEPEVSWYDRGNHRATEIEQTWEDGVLTLVVAHNGPVEITVKCQGAATDRQTEWTEASIEVPERPSVYTGALQYEAEFFDYKNIGACHTNGYYQNRPGYYGQGFVELGANRQASLRDTVRVLRSGTYTVTLRYQADATATIRYSSPMRRTLRCAPTGGEWAEISTTMDMEAGANELVIDGGGTNMFIDCVKLSIGNAQVYDFENDVAGGAAAMLTLTEGDATVVAVDGGQALQSAAAGRATLDMFPVDGTDYGVSWKQVSGDAGVLLRGGYLFCTNGAEVSIMAGDKILSEGEKGEGMTCFRATVWGDKLYLDGSVDGESWTTLAEASDGTYTAGGTSLVWDGAMTVDDIRLYRTGLTVSQTELDDITMTYGGTDVVTRTLEINGADLLGDVELSLAGDAFEISLDSLEGYTNALVIDGGQLVADGDPVRVFIRLKSDLGVSDYEETLTVSTRYQDVRTVDLKGRVTPAVTEMVYDFENDAVSSVAKNPPASGITRGTGNLCTSGVSNYTDADGLESKMLKVYTAPSRNGTGVLNLEKFTRKSTDYSVTWRQVLITSPNHKNGVILRGDTTTIGTASKGYTQGIMAGYYMNVYNHDGVTEFRIYKSTESTSLNMFNSATVNLSVGTNRSVWYRASVSGTSRVELKLEYSTDGGETWELGTATTDEGGQFSQGATQFVWGLAGSQGGFLIDDISFEGITYEGVETGIYSVEDATGEVVREEYFDLSGRRIVPGSATRGVVIRRSYLSNGAVRVDKLLMK